MLSRAEIHHVSVCAESRVVGQIPARVVGIFVDHDRIIVPVPIRGVIIIVRRYAEEPVVEPKAIAVSSAKTILVAAAEASREATVFPRMIHVIVFVTPAGIVADPRVIVMNVRRFWMFGAIAERTTILLRVSFLGAAFLGSRLRRTAFGSAIFS